MSADLPTTWNLDQNVKWVADLPGSGWSAPVVAGELVFLTAAVAKDESAPVGFGEGVQSMGSFYRSSSPDKPYRFELQCLNLATGEMLWSKEIANQKPPYKIHPSNSYATESPLTDGENVFAYFASIGVVVSYDLDGNQIWKKDVGAYQTGNDFGTGSSLALSGHLLFVQCDNEVDSFVCALNASSGEENWRASRQRGASWSSPVVWENNRRVELVTCGNGVVTSYDPATGNELWKLTGAGGAFSATPTFDRDRIYLGQSGRTSRGPLVAVNAGAAGELTYDSLAASGLGWVSDSSAPGMCSPVVVDNRVFVLSRGILSCHDCESGKLLQRERLQNGSSVTSSLWASGSKVFALNETGETNVVEVGDEFQMVGTNSLDGLFWSTPSATDRELLIRSSSQLYCIGS